MVSWSHEDLKLVLIDKKTLRLLWGFSSLELPDSSHVIPDLAVHACFSGHVDLLVLELWLSVGFGPQDSSESLFTPWNFWPGECFAFVGKDTKNHRLSLLIAESAKTCVGIKAVFKSKERALK